MTRQQRWGLGVCVGAALVHSILSWSAVSRKAPTYDEVVDTFCAWVSVRHTDHRVVAQPPLYKYLAAFPLLFDPPKLPHSGPVWEASLEDREVLWGYCIDAMYRTPGVDGVELVSRSRRAMLIVPLLLGALLALWGWRLGGPLAGAATALAFALDPNFLGHGALVKEDVLLALALVALALSLERVGERVTPGRVGLAGVAAAACLGAKLSGVIAGPVILVTLLLRASLPASWTPGPWKVGEREFTRRRSKLGLALGLSALIGLIGWIGLWSLYRFRGSPTPDPEVRLPGVPSELHEEVSEGGGRLVKTVFGGLEDAGLLPQQFTSSLLYITSLRQRFAYLDGEVRRGSFRGYYPRVFLYKLPLATLAALLGTACLAGLGVRRRWRCEATSDEPEDSNQPGVRWSLVCAGSLCSLYGVFAWSSGTNMGIRHVFPLYAAALPWLGWGAVEAWRRYGGRAAGVLGVLGAGLLLETGLAFPNYIAFFNAAVGGSRGGIHRLGDSNLDWGQDLAELARWRAEHPEGTLYLCYFGTTDPHAYGLDYVNLPGGYPWGPRPYQVPTTPGVIAISATHLQGIYLDRTLRSYYAPLLQEPPRAVLGGTIYVFDVAGSGS